MTSEIWSEFMSLSLRCRSAEISEQVLDDFKDMHRETYILFCKQPMSEEAFDVLGFRHHKTLDGLEGRTPDGTVVFHFGTTGWEVYNIDSNTNLRSTLTVPQRLDTIGQLLEYTGLERLIGALHQI
jgi:hypothetical protein